MDSCLSTDLILGHIISKLNLREKFGVQGVSRQWKNIALKCLRHHKYLVISENPPGHFWYYANCDEPPSLITGDDDNLIWGKQTDLQLWQSTLSLLQGVKYVYMDVTTHDERGISFSIYKPILQLLMDSCGQSLEYLCIPNHKDYEDETFPLTDFLPRLKHMLLNHTSSQVTKNILSACPNLEYLRSSTDFTEWQMLPKGFKRLQNYFDNYFENFGGINNLLCSPAVESLAVVETILMTSEICYQSYHLSCLKRFEVTIDFEVRRCLTRLARILSFAPVLSELSITIAVSDEIEPQVWIKVLSECQTLTKLEVHLREPIDIEIPLINVSLFQDDFAKTIVSKMKKLEYLYIDFHLSSHGLRLLSQLDNLDYFRHKIHTENMSYDSVFDTDALTYFLSSSFDKKLTNYRIDIPRWEYVVLKESFYNFIYEMERKHFLRFNMRLDNGRYTEGVHKIPGMIYITGLDVEEWDLMFPDLNNTER